MYVYNKPATTSSISNISSISNQHKKFTARKILTINSPHSTLFTYTHIYLLMSEAHHCSILTNNSTFHLQWLQKQKRHAWKNQTLSKEEEVLGRQPPLLINVSVRRSSCSSPTQSKPTTTRPFSTRSRYAYYYIFIQKVHDTIRKQNKTSLSIPILWSPFFIHLISNTNHVHYPRTYHKVRFARSRP